MDECDYCGEAFDDEEALLAHMAEQHRDDLGRIDRRRVADLEGDGGDLPVGPIALALIIFVSAAIVAFTIFGIGGGGNGSESPASVEEVAKTPYGSAHEHGTMEVVVLGEPVDFSQSKYQVAARDFHFENGDGTVWHAHAKGVTVEYALSTLGIGVTADSVTFQGTTYVDGEGYNVSITVNGEPVDPTTYVLEGAPEERAQQGDHVRVVVRRTDGS